MGDSTRSQRISIVKRELRSKYSTPRFPHKKKLARILASGANCSRPSFLSDSLIGNFGFRHALCSSRRAIHIPALPSCHFEVRVAKPKPDRYPKELRSLGDHLRARRIDLGLFQSAVAELIGVHELTITNWERNATEPEVQYMPAIIRFLGHDPSAAETPLPFPERLAAARRARGLTQKQLAVKLRVDPTTVRDWESGQHKPSRNKLDLITAVLR